MAEGPASHDPLAGLQQLFATCMETFNQRLVHLQASHEALAQHLASALQPQSPAGAGSAQITQQTADPPSTPSRLPPSVKVPYPANFYGSREDTDRLEQWLFAVEQYFAMTGMSGDSLQVPFAGSLLRGPAQAWYRTMFSSSALSTWTDFLREIRSNFRPVNLTRHARDKLVKLVQDRGVQEYICAFRSIILDIPDMNQSEKIERFTRGLKPHIYREVMLKDPSSLDEAVKWAVAFDTANRAASFAHPSSWRPQPSRPPHHFHQQRFSGPTPMMVDHLHGSSLTSSRTPPPANRIQHPPVFTKLTPELRAQLMREGKCLYCREKGHMREQCPKRPQQHAQGNGPRRSHSNPSAERPRR